MTGKALLLPKNIAFQVAFADALPVALGNEHAVATKDVGIHGILQAVDLPARLAVAAKLQDAANTGVLLDLDEQRIAEEMLSGVESGQVTLRVSPLPTPEAASPLPSLSARRICCVPADGNCAGEMASRPPVPSHGCGG